MAFLFGLVAAASFRPGIGRVRLQRTYIAAQHIRDDQGKNTNTVA
ncbi:hypothetical protein X767_29500 [Mesorhizobium sp. LSJC264A00]|nr:hypothetical protein X767_29500 [Mesorhizobium sp. LSJC264A00]